MPDEISEAAQSPAEGPTFAVYLRTVETLFLGLRGSGLMLSPADVAVVQRWFQAGAPLRAVCRALVLIAERSTEPNAMRKLSLRYCSKAVMEHVKLERAVQLSARPAPPASPTEQPQDHGLYARAEQVLRDALSKPHAAWSAPVQQALSSALEALTQRRASARVEPVGPEEASFHLAVLDDALDAAVEQGLNSDELTAYSATVRRDHPRQLEALPGPERGLWLRRRAVQLARQRLGLPILKPGLESPSPS
jgi:hypothetical protein